MWRLVVACTLLAACGDNINDALYFTFDARPVLCALPLDDYLNPVDWDRLQERIDTAVDQRWVLSAYAHTPGESIAVDTLDRAFTMFEDAGLRFTRFAELDPAQPPFAGVVFSFDDDAIDAWFAMRDLFARHGALVTFFVTQYAELTEDGRAKLHMLADEGHDIEAHGVHHLDAVEYSAEHGADAYLTDEVLPSFQILRDDGFTPESFAYPYGSRSDETDRVIEPYARYLRTTAGPCDR